MQFVFLDLELGRDGRFHGMALKRLDVERVWDGPLAEAHEQALALVEAGDVLVGHNLHLHDLPHLRARLPDSPLLSMPTLDTLELSVLAFPARPYHNLVKGERLVRDSRPKPLSDVRQCAILLAEAADVLRELPALEAEILVWLIGRVEVEDTARQGWTTLLQILGRTVPATPPDLEAAWRDRVCCRAPELADPPRDLPFLLVAAWLRAVDAVPGSVLPAWVRRQWPHTTQLTRSLRATACGAPDCRFCATMGSPEHWLDEVFGFASFRQEPRTPQGDSLQRTLVERGLQGRSTFGILPTGGGKSLCFQVPAEARFRRLGQLTLVISPLQSLMKDQVDALRESRRIEHARAIYGGLPSLLRPAVIEEVRSGACGLLYLAPEQLRNPGMVKLISQRELGAVVFDEAHCLSQWGHDFRTDYPYVLKVIGEMAADQGVPMPPVFLFTATGQHDAIQEILAHVHERTGEPVELLDGGSERHNLEYQVQHVPVSSRVEKTAALIREHRGQGSVIVFCGTRGGTDELAERLHVLGIEAVAYHAGLDAQQRREIQDAFLRDGGVIVATNAFGMGVDKDDVRLVVHVDMPSSLEAYLQEAGRAGRDGEPALAVLLWQPGDADARFALAALGDLEAADLGAVWRAVQDLPQSRVMRGGQSVERRAVTPMELLFQEALIGRFETLPSEETRVKAAVNWLERARVLERRENLTRVFTGSPTRKSVKLALAEVEHLDLAPGRVEAWKAVLTRIYEAGDDGLSADDIAVLCGELKYEDPLEGGLRVLHILHQLADAGLVSRGQTFTAFVAWGVQDASEARRERWVAREDTVLAALEEDEGWQGSGRVHLQALATLLSSPEAACTVNEVSRMLGSWCHAYQGVQQGVSPVRFRARGVHGHLHIEASLGELKGWLRTRHQVAGALLKLLTELARAGGKRGQVLVASELERLVDAVKQDLMLGRRVHDPVEAVRSAVGWLHDLRIITVQNGLAVFRSAMCLDRAPGWPGLKGDQARAAREALRVHREHKILRVHVMDEWARTMLADPQRGERLRADWFALPIDAFTERWFPRRKEEIHRPTTAESYRRIVTELRDPEQQAIVTADRRTNHLVLAGPGSGKTRVLVHRVAWLIRCKRVRASHIAVVCYTRANAIELRKRLTALVGRDGRRVRIQTLHALALTLVGSHRLKPRGDLSLDACLDAASEMLEGEKVDETRRARNREGLLRGFQYLFIDEYQDIDARKYRLLSAIAGRAMGRDQRKLRVFAVGDDDQAIFAWDGASDDFIRSFEADYSAKSVVLHHSYRSPRAVLELAQDLVADLPGRLKAGETLRVDPARADDPPMGAWASAHPVLAGRILQRRAISVRAAACAAMETVHGLVDEGVAPETIAVLAPTRPAGLNRLRIEAERLGLPIRWQLPGGASLPMGRIRECTVILDVLADRQAGEGERGDLVAGGELAEILRAMPQNHWSKALSSWLEPQRERSRPAVVWRNDLYLWARSGGRARMIGEGVHLGTMHSAKGLEFDHVLILDDGCLKEDDPQSRRLLYVALTRARRSLWLFTPAPPSPVFQQLRHASLLTTGPDLLAAQGVADRAYGVIGLGDVFIDWLGRRPAAHPGHAAMERAQPGDAFRLERRGSWVMLLDGHGVEVGALSKEARPVWLPRIERGLRLRLLAATRQSAEDRTEAYRQRLRVATWWTGVWEARWRR